MSGSGIAGLLSVAEEACRRIRGALKRCSTKWIEIGSRVFASTSDLTRYRARCILTGADHRGKM